LRTMDAFMPRKKMQNVALPIKKKTKRSYANARDVLPQGVLEALQSHHIGLLWVPKAENDPTFYGERRRQVLELHREGIPTDEIATCVGITPRRVQQIVAESRSQESIERDRSAIGWNRAPRGPERRMFMGQESPYPRHFAFTKGEPPGRNPQRRRRQSRSKRQRGAQKGNANAWRHGIYADRFLLKEEKVLFDLLISQFEEDLVLNSSSDFLQVELAVASFIHLGRAIEADDVEAAERIDRMLRCHLKELKATRAAREGDGPMRPEITPAEWATSLLERLAAEKEAERQYGKMDD